MMIPATATVALSTAGPTFTVTGVFGAMVLAVLVLIGLLLLTCTTARTAYYVLKVREMLLES